MAVALSSKDSTASICIVVVLVFRFSVESRIPSLLFHFQVKPLTVLVVPGLYAIPVRRGWMTMMLVLVSVYMGIRKS